jgi:hypothetical protein
VTSVSDGRSSRGVDASKSAASVSASRLAGGLVLGRHHLVLLARHDVLRNLLVQKPNVCVSTHRYGAPSTASNMPGQVVAGIPAVRSRPRRWSCRHRGFRWLPCHDHAIGVNRAARCPLTRAPA